MKNLVVKNALIFVALGFFGCSDSLPESITGGLDFIKWQMPQKSSKSNEAKIKVPYLALGVADYPSAWIAGYIGVDFKEKDSTTQIKDIKLYPRNCGVVIHTPKDFKDLSDEQKIIAESEENQKSLKWYSNNDEDTAKWNKMDKQLKAFWQNKNLRYVNFTNCEAKDISKVELITDNGTFTYEFK